MAKKSERNFASFIHFKHEHKNTSSREILKENLSCELYSFILNGIYSSNFILKIIFSLFVLTGLCLGSYTTVNLILSYLDFNVITTVRTINETPAVFPKVTICNKNFLTTKYAHEFLSKLIGIQTWLQLENSKRPAAILRWIGIQSKVSGLIQNFSIEEKKKFSHDLSDILFYCSFNYGLCTEKDFIWEWDDHYGNCYSFNSGFNLMGQRVTLKKTNFAGSTFGLSVEFYVNFYEELMLFNSINSDYGLIVRIDNISHVIDYSLGGISVSAGTHTYLALNREFKSSLPKPYSNCDDLSTYSFKSDLYNLILQSKYEYTRQFCIVQCLQEMTIELCNCSYASLVWVRNESKCLSRMQLECLESVYFNKFLQDNYIQNKCSPKCPLECNSTKITYSLSSSQIISKAFINEIQQNPQLNLDFINRSIQDENVISKSVVKLNIFYDSLSYTNYEESPQWDIITLVASIGGNLGLFLGVCMFSLGELLVTFIELILFKLEKKKAVNDSVQRLN